MIDNKKLKELIKHLVYHGIVVNQTNFAEKLGYDKSTISGMIIGKKPISESFANKVSELFNVRIEWMRTGEGEMLRKNTETLPSSNKDKISTLNEMIANIQKKGKCSDKIRFIPLLSLDAVGGTDNDIADSPEYVERLIPVNGVKEKSILISVSGDSMMPIFNPGDYVVIDEVVEWNLFLEMGQYYVVALKDNRRLIKKVTYSEIDRNLNFLLVSINENYPPVELPKSLIMRMFIVTQKHQKLTL